MSDTINIGGITVSKFYLGDSSNVKIYLGTTKLYPHLQEPCFAVVDNISTYTARTYVDVYETSSDKWYKLNNLGNYEKYGIYGSGRNITYYDGKLTIDGDYEYQYSGNSWVNVGEISGDTHDYSQYYLTLQALESGTIGFSAGTVDYSTDSGSTWNTLAQGNTISVSQGDEVLFKKSGSIPTENYGIGTFTSSCRFNVYGNIMSMQEGDNFATATTIYAQFQFKRLFAESKVVSAENMVLPATTLQNFCYNELFNTATYLTTPPKIFPATVLTQDCYSFAFNSCTSLTKTPVLPALTAARASYGWMFQNCTSLSEVACLATDVSAMYATYDWLSNVASSGTFYKNPNASWPRGTSGIPSNWNVEEYVEPTPSVYPVYYDEIQDPPNNVTFTSMTEAESYECPWVGMRATIAGSAYTFTSGYTWEYIDIPVLPDVPFILNYNAKNYDTSTYSIAKTSGQTKDVDAVCDYGYHIVDHSTDGYITVTGNTRMLLTGTTYMGRNNTETGCTMTIVSKVRTTSGYSILTNRGRGGYPEMNWMWRYPTDGIFLHGSSSYSSAAYHTSTNTNPIIASVRTYYDGGVKQTLNDWTNNGSYSGSFGYGDNYNGNSALFCDYASSDYEFWQGDFYWVYMSQSVLTDEQIQQVINYNENLIV